MYTIRCMFETLHTFPITEPFLLQLVPQLRRTSSITVTTNDMFSDYCSEISFPSQMERFIQLYYLWRERSHRDEYHDVVEDKCPHRYVNVMAPRFPVHPSR